jgi:hypothetical protein
MNVKLTERLDDDKAPDGFSDVKDSKNYWMEAVRDFWYDTGLDTDSMDLDTIVKWFDERRKETIR